MTDKNKDIRRQTMIVPAPVHREFRILAATEDKSQQALLEEALDLLFEKYQMKSAAEIMAAKETEHA